MEKGINSLIENLGEVKNLDKLCIFKPEEKEFTLSTERDIFIGLEEDRRILRMKVSALDNIYKEMKKIYNGSTEEIGDLKDIITPNYRQGMTRKLHKRLEILRTEQRWLSGYLRDIKEFRNILISMISNIDYLLKNDYNEAVIIKNFGGRYTTTKYTI